MSRFARVGVIGCGIMGSGIAECCARAGCDVIVCERDEEALEAGKARIDRSLERAVRGGKLDEDGLASTRSRLQLTTDLTRLADRELAIEAVAEQPAMKAEIFAALDAILPLDAIIASNTSSIPIAELAASTSRPASVVGMHFFNPVPVLPLVEIVPSVLTSEATRASAEAFATDVLGKNVIHSKDRAGFIVNALLIPFVLSAIRMVEAGFASASDIDDGMELGCAQPMGPLRLADFIGLDTVMSIAESLLAEFAEPLYAPPALLRRMVAAGLLGRKSGRGFHDYTGTSTSPA